MNTLCQLYVGTDILDSSSLRCAQNDSAGAAFSSMQTPSPVRGREPALPSDTGAGMRARPVLDTGEYLPLSARRGRDFRFFVAALLRITAREQFVQISPTLSSYHLSRRFHFAPDCLLTCISSFSIVTLPPALGSLSVNLMLTRLSPVASCAGSAWNASHPSSANETLEEGVVQAKFHMSARCRLRAARSPTGCPGVRWLPRGRAAGVRHQAGWQRTRPRGAAGP